MDGLSSMRIPRFRGDQPQRRRHYLPAGWRQVRPNGGCRTVVSRSATTVDQPVALFSVSAGAAKSWPQSRHRYVWVWAWQNWGDCPSSVLGPAAWTLASVGGGHVLAPCRSTLSFGCVPGPTAGVSKRLRPGWSVAANLSKPDGSRPDLRFVGGPGALRWVAGRQKCA
jgi:hypothetical protein